MNLQQQDRFYEMMTRLKANSRAASTEAKDDVMITEVTNGLIVTRPAKKIEYLSDSAKVEQEAQAKVWNLTKEGPVPESQRLLLFQ